MVCVLAVAAKVVMADVAEDVRRVVKQIALSVARHLQMAVVSAWDVRGIVGAVVVDIVAVAAKEVAGTQITCRM